MVPAQRLGPFLVAVRALECAVDDGATGLDEPPAIFGIVGDVEAQVVGPERLEAFALAPDQNDAAQRNQLVYEVPRVIAWPEMAERYKAKLLLRC